MRHREEETGSMLLEISMLEDDEIHRVSFGQVRVPRFSEPSSWEEANGTIYDPRIFGPERSWACPCGRIRGRESDLRICPECGVKVGIASIERRRRFGHITLREPIRHPLKQDCLTGVVPVLPIAMRDPGKQGHDLNLLYTQVLSENARAPALPGGSTADLLERRVQELYCNEWLRAPRLHNGRPLRSVLHYVTADAGTTLRSVGVYLQGLGAKLTAPAVSDRGDLDAQVAL